MNYRKLTKYEIAATIGYWRSGASNLEICALMNIHLYKLENIISTYLINKIQ